MKVKKGGVESFWLLYLPVARLVPRFVSFVRGPILLPPTEQTWYIHLDRFKGDAGIMSARKVELQSGTVFRSSVGGGVIPSYDCSDALSCLALSMTSDEIAAL